MSKLFIMAGTKGGIGKTLSASFLADIAAKAGYVPHLFDCDDENWSLVNMYGGSGFDIHQLDSNDKNSRAEFQLDKIVDEIQRFENQENSGDHAYIVDMKAGTSVASINWLELFPFSYVSEWNVEVYIVGCVTSDIDSIVTFAKWVEEFQPIAKDGKLRFIVIKNGMNGSDFRAYIEYLQPALEHELGNTIVLLIPRLHEVLLQAIKNAKTSWGQIAAAKKSYPGFSFMEIHRIKEIFVRLSREFEAVFGSPKTMELEK